MKMSTYFLYIKKKKKKKNKIKVWSDAVVIGALRVKIIAYTG